MIICKTIPEARSQAIEKAIMCGYVQQIERGSFENECFRIQLHYLSIRITNHCFDRVPVPPTTDWPIEMTQSHGENYYQKYILSPEPPNENEIYTYGSRINEGNQLAKAMDMLLKTPQTNQAVIEVGRREDIDLHEPSCLRGIQFVFDNDKLNMFVWFRSHDIFAGLPENFFGLSQLLADVAEYAGLAVGDFIYHGSASHLYNYQLDFMES